MLRLTAGLKTETVLSPVPAAEAGPVTDSDAEAGNHTRTDSETSIEAGTLNIKTYNA